LIAECVQVQWMRDAAITRASDRMSDLNRQVGV
jgi:hypothetical protein